MARRGEQGLLRLTLAGAAHPAGRFLPGHIVPRGAPVGGWLRTVAG